VYPLYHLELARESLLQQEVDAAVREICKGVALLRLSARRATVAVQKALNTAAADLTKLADRLTQGEAVADQEYGRAFFQAQYALTQ
jgi:hypothetical protein